MNNLVLDIGNSNIVVGYCVNRECSIYRYETDKTKSSEFYKKLLKKDLEKFDVDNILISSVVPIVTEHISEALSYIFDLPINLVDTKYYNDLVVDTDKPEEVGSDLLCGVYGAMEYSSSGIVIDLGTASKLSYYSDNTFKGVVIAPGIKVSANSLTSSASLLSEFTLKKPSRVFGSNTIECMQSGVILGHIAMINGLIEMAFKEIEEELPIYLTGGLSFLVNDDLKYKHNYNKDLLIDALDRMIYVKENCNET